ncbi:MAG: tRNA (adenosine(37)-N6)-threonylcarbamoyltransferase complex ATPase subunit type 1 TsaE [Candidatus Aquicultorales bacterium]
MEDYEIITRSVEETRALAKELAGYLQPGDVVSLTGDLGAGKTAFVQGLAEGLGVKERVTSPTFTIIKEYSGRLPLYHFDVYRLESAAELVDLGFEEYFFGEGVSVVEWGDRVRSLFPPDYLELSFEHAGPEKRTVKIAAKGERWERVIDSLDTAFMREEGA